MKRILLPRHRRVLYEIVAVLAGTAIAFAVFETDMRCFGLCVCLGMVYMIKTCPDRPTSLLTAIVAGLIGIGTEQWGCSQGLWNWVAPEFQPQYGDKYLKSVLMLNVLRGRNNSWSSWPSAGAEGFPLEVVLAYSGAGFWMGSISTRILSRELADEAAVGQVKGASLLLPPNLAVGLLQLLCGLIIAVEPPWQQSVLMGTLGITVLAKLHTSSAVKATLFWGLVVGFSGFFFEVYATGGVKQNFAVWRYDPEVTKELVHIIPMPFFRTAPISALLGYTGAGTCIFGSAFLMQSRGTSSAMDTATEWVRKLFTKEDRHFLHKMCGFYCLVHYGYRFAHTEFVTVGKESKTMGDMGFGGVEAGSWTTCASLLPHLLLSISSLIFSIPRKRISEGSRIWPEYRLHSIIFACRSLACMAVTWAEARWLQKDQAPLFVANAAIILLTMIAADMGTHVAGEGATSSTINDLSAPPALKYYFSVAQFHATASCLVGIRRFSSQFIYLWIIQVTAFLMTLRRKNLLPHTPLVYTYGIMLMYGMLVTCVDANRFGVLHMTMTLAAVAAVLRMGLALNKYVVWAIVSAAAHFARYTIRDLGCDKESDLVSRGKYLHGSYEDWQIRWLLANAIGVIVLTLLGIYKIKNPRRSSCATGEAASTNAKSQKEA